MTYARRAMRSSRREDTVALTTVFAFTSPEQSGPARFPALYSCLHDQLSRQPHPGGCYTSHKEMAYLHPRCKVWENCTSKMLMMPADPDQGRCRPSPAAPADLCTPLAGRVDAYGKNLLVNRDQVPSPFMWASCIYRTSRAERVWRRCMTMYRLHAMTSWTAVPGSVCCPR
ncbi:putative protein OS=Eoetvoesiella caeni OX=645616 GN=DFR37_11048 PE=4 SV=1 [Eoetvoesiella caeni]|uniref:Uncharacterized protein n=1 Tax=Eoetvoesiella caeni TaxID=645616 RepID=A0A366H6Q3_9BURK|nr:hypothetical protein DFR37_11048 [Eoetvoesiella caeni]